MKFFVYCLVKSRQKLTNGLKNPLLWVYSEQIFPTFIATLAVGLLLINRFLVSQAGFGFLISNDSAKIPSGILFNPIDNLFYASFPQQLFSGNVYLFLNPHTFLDQPRIYLNPLFWLVGKASYLLNLHPFGLLTIFGLISMVIVILTTYRISRAVGFSHFAASTSTVIIAFGSGLTGLLRILSESISFVGADINFQDALTFSTFYAYPYHSIAFALVSIIILLIVHIEDSENMEVRQRLIKLITLALLIALAASIHPYEVLMIGFSFGIFFILSFSENNKNKRSSHILILVTIAIGAVPVTIYNVWVGSQPAWQQFSTLAVSGLPRTRLYWLGGLGLTLILAVYGAIRLFLRKQNSNGIWLAIWVLLIFFLLIVINIPQSKIISGAFLSLAILAGYATDLIIRELSKFRSPIREIFLLSTFFLASGLLFTGTGYMYFKTYRAYYVDRSLVELVNELDLSESRSTKVLSHPGTSLEITALVPVQVYSSHWALTPSYSSTIDELRVAGLIMGSDEGEKDHLIALLKKICPDYLIINTMSQAFQYIEEIPGIYQEVCIEPYCLFQYTN